MILVLFTATLYPSFAGNPVIKFGKVTKEDLLLKECEFSPGADAMILGETAKLKFGYSDDKGWQYKITITRRIKIFNTQGKKHD